MLFHWLHKLGDDLNPQLLREAKGRLKPRSIIVTAIASFLGQSSILLYFQRRTQSSVGVAGRESLWSFYTQTEAGKLTINAQHACFDVFFTVTWVALTLLLFLGSYLFVSDIAREERRGTLDFMRSTPITSQSVLIGKLLGVPILLYLAIALSLPLHLWSAFSAGLSLSAMIGIDLVLVVCCAFVYVFSLLHSLSWGAKAQAWYILPLTGIIYCVLHGLGWYGSYQYDQLLTEAARQGTEPVVIDWVSGANHLLLRFVTILSISLTIISVYLWQICVKRFHKPPLRQ